MLTVEQSALLRSLREDANTHIVEMEKLILQCGDEPIAIQIIWTAISEGYKASLGRGIIHAMETVGDDPAWIETIRAAQLALGLWEEFEQEHGDESLLDFSKFDELSMRAFRIETDAHARNVIATRGQAYRDAAVSFDLWIRPHLRCPRPVEITEGGDNRQFC
jgi:hypothetical protein